MQLDHAGESDISKHLSELVRYEEVRLHARHYLERIEADKKKAAAERRAGREVGKLTRGVCDGLRACNPLQLKAARALIAKYEKSHRNPPSLHECKQNQTEDILAHADVRNRRYTLELRRSSRSRGKVYVNGPYVIVHHRDGQYIKHQYIGNKKLSTRLPRTVWPVFRTIMTSPETLALIAKRNMTWADSQDHE